MDKTLIEMFWHGPSSGKSMLAMYTAVPVIKVYEVQIDDVDGRCMGFRLAEKDAQALAEEVKAEHGGSTRISEREAVWFCDDLYLLDKITDPKLKG